MSDQAASHPDTPASPPVAARVPARPIGKLERIWDHDSRDDDRPVSRNRPPRGVGIWPWSTGVLPRSAVRMTCFIVLALSMFGAGALCLMAVWEATSVDVAWRSIVSLGIVAALMAGFTLLNEVFGPKKGDTTA